MLDVTDPEPLPAGDPLWTAPGMLCITPHFAGGSPLSAERSAELAGDQLARWCAGEPLHNVVRGADRCPARARTADAPPTADAHAPGPLTRSRSRPLTRTRPDR